MMIKNIKKSLKYFIIFIGSAVAVLTVFYFLLRTPVVQTLIVRRISSHISGELRSSINIGKVHYHFFNRLIINDILIKDQNNDTLIYSQKVTAAIRKLDFGKKTYRLGRLIFDDPLVSVTADSTGMLNINRYVEFFRSKKDTTKTIRPFFGVNQIEVNNGKFLLSLNKNKNNKNISAIDFASLALSEINGILEDFSIYNDTTRFNIYNLEFLEKGGFRLRRMNSGFLVSQNYLRFNTAFVESDSSILNIKHASILRDTTVPGGSFVNSARLELLLERSQISTNDLRYFVPSTGELNETGRVSGRIYGTISELRGRDIRISCLDNTYLDCDFDFSGLPEIENSFIYFGINDFRSSAADIEKINIPGSGPPVLPEILHKLGPITMDGSFTGFITDFVAYCKIRSEMGLLKTDISMRPEESNRFRVNGLVTGSNIDMGHLLEQPEITGTLSMNVNLDGTAYSLDRFSGDLSGLIDSIEINDYKYRNIELNGSFTEKTWDGSIGITDDNIRMDLLGMFNFNRKLPEFDFTLNLAYADLYRLNFDRADSTSSISMLMTANIKGSNIDNIDGEIKMLNSSLRKYGETLNLYDFSIKTFVENNLPAISLRTDYIDADLRGYYDFSGLGTMIRTTLASVIPSHFKIPVPDSDDLPNHFTFEIEFKNTDRLNNFFKTGLLIAENSFLGGEIITDSLFSISGESSAIKIGSNTFNDFSINGNLIVPSFYLEAKSSSLMLFDQSPLNGFTINLNSISDTILFNLGWDNEENILNRGNLNAELYVRSNINNEPSLFIDIDPSEIYTRNNLWKISRSEVVLDSSSLTINDLYINNNEHYYSVDGTVSEDSDDTLRVIFKGIDIAPANVFLQKNAEEGKIPLNIKGDLNGSIVLTNIYNNPLLESDIRIREFSMLESEYGDITVNTAWDNTDKVLNISAGNDLNGLRMLDIKGFYDPDSKEIDLDAGADKLPVDALNRLLGVFASGISGTASGNIRFGGEVNKMILKGALMLENTSMKIDYLQTEYLMNDSVRFDKNLIIFKDLRTKDERGNYAVLNGSVNHNYFRDYRADITINAENTMVLNTRPKDNESFYGTVFATGVVNIRNNAAGVSFEISGRTERNTRFNIPLNSSETMSDYSYITFVDHDTLSNQVLTVNKIVESNIREANIDLNIDLEVTPDAEVQLIFDSKIGDVMKGHGSGNLNISLKPGQDLRISGDYVIEDGDYLFTLGNIFNKPFSVEDGGTIVFNGDINSAQLDIRAIYRLKASLYEILQDERYNERIPVECHINLSGDLFNPIVDLDIFLPMADEATRAYLRNVVTTEEEMSRQFLYLLVMNSFYADPSYGSSFTATTTTTGTSAMAVTTTEMVSNQLSNWVSQISNDFDIGFVYRPGYKDLNSDEVQLALSTQLLNDRVIINGNFDVRGPGETPDNTDQLIGDFDIEYKLTENIRFKVFNRFNNPYTGRQTDYTQGIGVFFKKDFDRFADLFRKKMSSEMKREEEPGITGQKQ